MEMRPNGLKYLFFSEFAERFSYYGIQSLLVLYFLKALDISNTLTYTTYGAFTALSFIMAILGGLLADKWFGFRKLVLLGMALSLIGNLVLAVGIKNLTTFGLTCLIFGAGLFVPNNSNLLGTFYEAADHRRARDFTIFYIGTNVGGLLGPVMYGILATYNWNYPFAAAAVFIAGWLLLYFKNKNIFRNHGLPPSSNSALPQNKKRHWVFVYLTMIGILIASFLILENPVWAGKLLIVVGLVSLLLIVITALRKQPQECKNIFMLILMIICALLFFASAFQIYTSLLMFVDQDVNRNFINWEIPSSAFSSLEPFFIVLISPLAAHLWKHLSYKNKEPSPLTKLATGLLLAGFSFGIFSLSAYYAAHSTKNVSILWILSGNLLLGLGEICIIPTLIATITQLAPKTMKGTMMGLLYLALAFSGYFAGVIGKLTAIDTQHNASSIFYFHVYIKIFYLALGISTIIYGISYLIKRTQGNGLSPTEKSAIV